MREKIKFSDIAEFVFLILVAVALIILCFRVNVEDREEIKQLKQSVVEQKQEAESYRNRSLELENIIEESGLVVDNCECY